ncbi:MAG: PhoH family protein [Candidatus Hydrogenedentota bacterium]|nr:MAG: PhoH family protein [Candidatus Hydrogenedentota bacterium]
MKEKVFVLDTNVLLHDSNCLFVFGEGNEVVVPITVLEELDAFKKRQDEVGRNSRQVTRELDELRRHGRLIDGVPLDNGGTLRIALEGQDGRELPAGFDTSKNDIRILNLAFLLTKEEKVNRRRPVTLITKDINLRVKADAVGVRSEDYERGTVNLDELYTGYRTLAVSAATVDGFYKEGRCALPEGEDCFPNEFVMLEDSANPSHTALGRFDSVKKEVQRLAFPDDGNIFGIKPLNREQRFVCELLMDDAVPLVALVGYAGTGKTLLSLAAGLEKVVNEDVYRKLLVCKPIIPVGKDIGYLPGDVDEKLMPRMQSVADNLEYLFLATSGEDGGADRLQELIEDNIIELEPLTYIRGRSIPRQFIIVDEAQNLTPLELKTIITRAGKGSKIILCGDPYQIDHPYLDSRSNGLTYVVEGFKGENLFGTVTLKKGERSELAETAARIM